MGRRESSRKKAESNQGAAPVDARIGYLSLPAELRHQILEEALIIDDCVRPIGGPTVHRSWRRDIDIVIAAQRQALKDLIRYRHSLKVYILYSVTEGYFTIILTVKPTICRSTADVAPHFLSVCRTAYEEGHPLFYSQNTFQIPPGPLSVTKQYFDGLQPEHRRLIRKVVLNISLVDLTVETMDAIESQLRARDVARGRLPHDGSVDDWVAPIVYNIISVWRSKIAWLRDWTWLGEVSICSFPIRSSDHLLACGCPSDLVSWKGSGVQLPHVLKGIGPAEPHTPVMDCYGQCDTAFAEQMRRAESHLWKKVQLMIFRFGWKCSKALVRRLAYERYGEDDDDDDDE
ncbi:MAG: hypothetical protein LQ338_008219 [Usnochroma carphineum]|nr:MAG: hypothetical protein LQ338_008219 [Usnochroma carphineum]